MKLTGILCKCKKKPPGGHMWRGKYRLYREVTPEALNKKKLEFQLEEQNMFFLRHPYLTVEQQAFLKKTTEHDIKLQMLKDFVWAQHEYLGDRMGFLKISDGWED